MFRRLVFENTATIFTIVAFLTAASIYVTFAWRALRMKRPQLARFENLPFATPTPSAAALHASAGSEAAPVALSRLTRRGLPTTESSVS